ncbi:helix-turn-helix domain-containing protein [Plantactinospora siamensis]|uniref:Helix-turn-helix domain-containing protein n=1 Tax=Plantactinospora siamensis TaxID=555372 RepID=A0ABV6NW28_9ACTN
MGRQEAPLDSDQGEPRQFAAALRRLRAEAGNPSYRELERRTNYSRTTLAEATKGRGLPSQPVALALAAALGGDPAEWRHRWDLAWKALHQQQPVAEVVAPALSPQPVADGADPDAAGCLTDAVTAHARKVSLHGRQRLVGQIELRWSPGSHAAWARFEPYRFLEHLAGKHAVELELEVCRESDGARTTYRDEFMYDTHWSDLLCTFGSVFVASVVVYLDGVQAAVGATDRRVLD